MVIFYNITAFNIIADLVSIQRLVSKTWTNLKTPFYFEQNVFIYLVSQGFLVIFSYSIASCLFPFQCNPHAEQLFTNRGLIQQFMGDKASAMKNYQTAISLNPEYSLAYFNAANLFFYNGQFEQVKPLSLLRLSRREPLRCIVSLFFSVTQACEYYSRAFELDPSDESAILNRAITHALMRKVPASLQDFNEALCLNPLSAHAYLNRANLYCSLRQFQSAERDLTQGEP